MILSALNIAKVKGTRPRGHPRNNNNNNNIHISIPPYIIIIIIIIIGCNFRGSGSIVHVTTV